MPELSIQVLLLIVGAAIIYLVIHRRALSTPRPVKTVKQKNTAKTKYSELPRASTPNLFTVAVWDVYHDRLVKIIEKQDFGALIDYERDLQRIKGDFPNPQLLTFVRLMMRSLAGEWEWAPLRRVRARRMQQQEASAVEEKQQEQPQEEIIVDESPCQLEDGVDFQMTFGCRQLEMRDEIDDGDTR